MKPLKHDIAARWAESDYILCSDEIGHEDDTRRCKVGDGKSKWSALPYCESLQYAVLLALRPAADARSTP